MVDLSLEKEDLYCIFSLLLQETQYPARILLDIVFDTVDDYVIDDLFVKVIRICNNKRSKLDDNEIPHIKK